MKLSLSLAAVIALAGCPNGNTGVKRPYPDLTVPDVLAKFTKQREARKAFTAESKMDYWIGDQRVKGDVLVMGTSGKKVRFNALSPAGGDVLVDMACGGTNFAYVDKQNNCQLAGPCDKSSIAALLRIALEPDDFLHLALGTPPILAGATGTVTWDGSRGYEKVDLKSAAGTQTITIDAREGRWDVIDSEMKDTSGKTVWSLKNAEFELARRRAGRAPPADEDAVQIAAREGHLVVEWGQRTINPTIDDAKFVVAVPEGLPRCGPK